MGDSMLRTFILLMIMILTVGCGGGSNGNGSGINGDDFEGTGEGGRAETGGVGNFCPPLPAASGNVITVSLSQVSNLGSIVNNASSGDTISLEDGTYPLNGDYIWIATDNITIRSQSGNREAVIIDGNYQSTEIITIAAGNVTIADITLKRARTHAIHVISTDGDDTIDTLIYNVHIIDPGQQGIKINPHSGKVNFTDDGTIACSVIELTDTGRPKIHEINGSCYTGGIDAHQSKGWIIRDNYIEGFWCDTGLSEHAIHFWAGGRDTLVERNNIINNARGIGFGLYENPVGRTYNDADSCNGTLGHVDGIIRNNFIFANEDALRDSEYAFDNGISMAQACGAQIVHNTVFSTFAPFSSIEWRFEDCDVDLINNLVSHNLRARNGASANLTGNIEAASPDIFVDAAAGDLHLDNDAAVAIDQGGAVSSVLCGKDIDGEIRDSTPDVGADEIE